MTRLVLSLMILSSILCGCDGYYYLLPLADESRAHYQSAGNELIVESENAVVKIRGGGTQSPYTGKVQAGHLSVYVELEVLDSSECVFTSPVIHSAGQCISLSSFNAYHKLKTYLNLKFS